jgi:OOP family OmpA-OmpF porin
VRRAAWPLAAALALPLRAGALVLPGEASLVEPPRPDSLAIATAPWDAAEGTLPHRRVEGLVAREVRVVEAGEATTLEIMAGLRAQLALAGQEPAFECADRDCGGFDFRFALEVAPAPAMFVNLADYRYLAAATADEAAWTVLLVTRAGGAAYVQATTVAALEGLGAPPEAGPAPRMATRDPPGPLAAELEARGRAVLAGVRFASGSPALEPGADATLAALAAALDADPGLTLALVGHSDTEGGTAGNLALSRARAQAVREALIARHGVAPGRLIAEGVGYLAPLAPNATPEGRALNRRVEAVVTSLP